MNSDKIHDIIGRYLAGEVSENERAETLNWINSSDEHKKEFELHKNSWEDARIKFDAQNADLVFRNVLTKIDDQQEREISKIEKGNDAKGRVSISLLAKIAAGLIIFATLVYFIQINKSHRSSEPETIALNTKENPSGQKSKIYLPDGSVVWLNAESKLSFPEIFSKKAREVKLEGEAFFDVIKKADHPFIVRSNNITTTVLGTSFNVRSFSQDNLIQIALKDGKVKVELEGETAEGSIYLEPGEAVEYNKENSKIIKQKIDLEKLFAWKDGTIVFKDADLDEIIGCLSSWYGVKIEIKNRRLDNWTYTGKFPNENLENVLRSISFSEEFSYKIDQKNITIDFHQTE